MKLKVKNGIWKKSLPNCKKCCKTKHWLQRSKQLFWWRKLYCIRNGWNERIKKNNSPTVSVNQNTNVSITISLEQTINLIESIPNDKLSSDEKEQLEGKLSKLGTEKEKSKVWDKVLKWIADKGVEVGIAVLPLYCRNVKKCEIGI